MNNFEAVIKKLKTARSWKETEISISEMIELLELLSGDKQFNAENDAEKQRLKNKIERLTESNKQLIAENKKLKRPK